MLMCVCFVVLVSLVNLLQTGLVSFVGTMLLVVLWNILVCVLFVFIILCLSFVLVEFYDRLRQKSMLNAS